MRVLHTRGEVDQSVVFSLVNPQGRMGCEEPRAAPNPVALTLSSSRATASSARGCLLRAPRTVRRMGIGYGNHQVISMLWRGEMAETKGLTEEEPSNPLGAWFKEGASLCDQQRSASWLAR